ncbi:nitric oxide synthase oxygenase [Deinococcus aquiradiocola]|uniref:Nitric oxide synthase oxygenase n=1 Tax=Deinococcus aquiradiocola TaxID=393059 RepID=A0A917PD87_9DEIO|nr:nitric oxide synthase oxygenase [Deinococcus aquiradiocola]
MAEGTAALREAERFVRQFYRECPARPGEVRADLSERLLEVRRQAAEGGPQFTSPELAFGARLAWRNSTRCVGRGYWPALEVRDRRHVTRPDEVFAELLEHLRYAWNGGALRAVMTVFGPGVRVLNPQLIRYAAYRLPDGSVIGDPANLELTHHLMALGWPGGPRTPFDVLPVAVQSGGTVRLFTLPPDAVREVSVTHPTLPGVADLGLRWHALPVISDMRLEVGGVSFLCAPFSGWYLQTEIAARNLADRDRYDVLPALARALGLDTRRERTLWRDRAQLELNVAVLHSFDAAGVKIDDHHTVTRRFVRFEEREARAGRAVYGRWSWLVPPVSGALTPVWHRSYRDVEITPNFFPQATAWPAGVPDRDTVAAGAPRCPFHT